MRDLDAAAGAIPGGRALGARSMARLVEIDDGPPWHAPHALVLRITQRPLAGSDLRVERRRVEPTGLVPRATGLTPAPLATPAALIALARVASVARMRRGDEGPIAELVLGRASRGMPWEPLLDELRAHDRVDELVSWLVRGRPQVHELIGERLSLARVTSARGV